MLQENHSYVKSFGFFFSEYKKSCLQHSITFNIIVLLIYRTAEGKFIPGASLSSGLNLTLAFRLD